MMKLTTLNVTMMVVTVVDHVSIQITAQFAVVLVILQEMESKTHFSEVSPILLLIHTSMLSQMLLLEMVIAMTSLTQKNVALMAETAVDVVKQ